MDVICFVCNKQSPGWHQKFTQLKLQHTDTPICEFIETLLADFESVRNIYDESNHICIECWLQFNEYDGAQTDKQKTKLRHLLVSTEQKLESVKITKSSEKNENEIEDDSHNRSAKPNVLKVTMKNIRNEFKPNTDGHPPTLCLISKNPSKLNPVLQLNRKRKITNTPKLKDAVRQIDKEISSSTTDKLNENSLSVNTVAPPSSSSTAANSMAVLKYPKPPFQYSCLIALALKNSHTGSLLASEIFRFICEHFPYFRTASANWKCSVRSELAHCFEKVDPKSDDRVLTKRYLWTMRSSEISKIDEKIQNCLRFKSMNIRSAMAKPEYLPALIRGDMKHRNVARLNDSIVSGNENKPTDSAFINEEWVQSDNDDKSSTFDGVNVDDPKLFPNKLFVEDSQLKLQLITKRAQHDHKESITANGLQMTFKDGFKPNTDVVKIHVVQPTLKLSHPPTMSTNSKNPSKLLTALQSNRKQLAKRTIETIPKPKDVVQLDCEEILPFTKITTSTTNLKEISSSMDTAAIPSLSPTHHNTPPKVVAVLKYPKPPFQYSCLIALALKNSRTGSLPVSEIYSFMCEHFPYFRTASYTWKHSVRSDLAHRFEKIERKRDDGVLTKKFRWSMRPSEITELVEKIRYNCPTYVRKTMAKPEHLSALIRGDMKHGNLNDNLAGLDGTIDSENESEPAECGQRSQLDNNDTSIAPKRIKTSTASITSKSQSQKFNGTETQSQRPPFSFSFSYLIAMALRNSSTGSLPVSEIYRFICTRFPYFKTATEDWKSSIRGTLASNKYFMKIEYKTVDGASLKDCLWSINPLQINELDKKIQKWSQIADGSALTVSENLPAIQRGEMKHDSLNEKIIGLEITSLMNDSSAEWIRTDYFEYENEPVDSVNNDEGNVQAVSECDNDACNQR